MDMTVGFFGLGAMGFPMAKRLLEAGVRLVITPHRNVELVGRLEALGACVVAGKREVIASADILASILPSDRELEDVFLDPANIAAFKQGAVLLDMTTAAPETIRAIARRLAEAGVGTVDAPVSGGVRGAINGTLSFFCGGADSDCDRVDPLLRLMGKHVFRLGGVGAGKATKSVNQALAAAGTVLTAEALLMLRKLKLDPETACQAISVSSGASAMFASKYAKMLHEEFRADFTVKLMRKDLAISRHVSRGLKLPVMEAAEALFSDMPDEQSALDISAVFLQCARQFRKNNP